MKINVNTKPQRVRFDTLKPGDAFSWYEDTAPCIKFENDDSKPGYVWLDTGRGRLARSTELTALVYPLNLEVRDAG